MTTSPRQSSIGSSSADDTCNSTDRLCGPNIFLLKNLSKKAPTTGTYFPERKGQNFRNPQPRTETSGSSGCTTAAASPNGGLLGIIWVTSVDRTLQARRRSAFLVVGAAA